MHIGGITGTAELLNGSALGVDTCGRSCWSTEDVYSVLSPPLPIESDLSTDLLNVMFDNR